MTIEEAVEMVDRLKPNQYEHEQKVKWLSNLDGTIFREVIMTHAGCRCCTFDGYHDADPDTVLLVPEPYCDDVYNYYLQSMIDRENAEITKYNQTSTMFNSAYKTFCDWYNRTHRPLPAHSQFLF